MGGIPLICQCTDLHAQIRATRRLASSFGAPSDNLPCFALPLVDLCVDAEPLSGPFRHVAVNRNGRQNSIVHVSHSRISQTSKVFTFITKAVGLVVLDH